jgi:hypothetical protein
MIHLRLPSDCDLPLKSGRQNFTMIVYRSLQDGAERAGLLLEASMKSTNEFSNIVDTTLAEIKELNEEIDLVPKIITKQLNGSSSDDFEFRPFTEKEKKEFVNSLDAKGRQILAELEGKPKRAPRLKPRIERQLFADFGKFNVA